MTTTQTNHGTLTTEAFGRTYTIQTGAEGIHFGETATVRCNGVVIYDTGVVACGAMALAQEWMQVEIRGIRIGRRLH
jgi:hypothetical protein